MLKGPMPISELETVKLQTSSQLIQYNRKKLEKLAESPLSKSPLELPEDLQFLLREKIQPK
jgi:hypothetical protein